MPARALRPIAMRLPTLAISLSVILHAANAGAITFGSDLTGAADNTGTCSLLSSPSCLFYSGAPGPSFYAPASGTVSRVRVKTGNFQQGPMQIVVMRSLFQNSATPGRPYFACCFVQQYGPVFTPAPNAVTDVPTALAMIVDPVPPPEDLITSARGDFLALAVLDPNVPIPASFDGATVFSGYAPAPNPQTTPAPSPNPLFASVNGSGYQILMQADLDPGGGGDALPVAIATGGQLVGSTANIPLICVLTTACRGVLRLSGAPARASTSAATRAKAYGKKRFVIPAGATASVSVKLNAAGRKLLGNAASGTVVATARVKKRVVTTSVSLVR
jgi:hypothetical protein